MSTLGAEIAAARLMAPFFGSSTVIWANTIAVVLLALSAGYWLGGRARRPAAATPRALRVLVLVGSALLAVVPFIAHPFLSLSVSAFDDALGRRVHGVAVRDARAGRGAAAAARRGVAVGDAAASWRRSRSRASVAGRLYAISTHRLAGRRVLRGAVGDRGDRDAAHVPRARRRAGAGRRGCGSARAALLVPVALLAALALPPGTTKPAEDGARALRDGDAVPVRARGRGRRTARAGSSSTRARRSTRCGGRARC